ncbi:MAG: hypothetical protein E7568_00985 [Ruminococcaceae bacterium]|nr:hypothetical protein [Oscillospiraceae bacterium]
MKKVFEKICNVLKIIFGYAIMITLFAGGLTFFGYIAALIIGGPTAEVICKFIYKEFLPVIIYVASAAVLLGLVVMYLSGQTALTTSTKKK